MTTISPFDVPSAEPFAPVPPNPDVDRLKTAIQSMQNYGVPPMFLFSVEDLYEVKHIPRVVRCLEELEKLVSVYNFWGNINVFFLFFQKFLIFRLKKRNISILLPSILQKFGHSSYFFPQRNK